MAVYVDDARHRYGRMTMCHMLADTEELHAIADRIGVARRWFQRGNYYDVCLSKRALAVKAGALEVTAREIVEVRRRFREGEQTR